MSLIWLEIVEKCQKRGDLIFTTSIKDALDDSNIIFIAVGTPMAEDGSANLDYIFSAAQDIADNISQDSLVVVKSTVPVGTTFKVQEANPKYFNCNGSMSILLQILNF